MKVTYQQLKQFVDFDMTPTELAEKLTSIGLEVKSMETVEATTLPPFEERKNNVLPR